MKFLIIGLGNIGIKYQNTRHNIGFDIIDEFAKKHNAAFVDDRLASHCVLKIKGKTIHCIKPSTYMNLSGKALVYWKNKLKVFNENILVIADDIALPVSQLRMRSKGSDAGHNGLKDIIACLQTENFPRLRFGIGNDYKKGQQAEFVLGKWDVNESELVNSGIKKAVDAIEQFVLEGIERTMNNVNRKA
ncbi:MAG: aminoacyl-tRNA hydrolase [Bacteroidetes bacterium]|nr:aminoacyl-tRNA hydrolase [Bacteroidota bacterium]